MSELVACYVLRKAINSTSQRGRSKCYEKPAKVSPFSPLLTQEGARTRPLGGGAMTYTLTLRTLTDPMDLSIPHLSETPFGYSAPWVSKDEWTNGGNMKERILSIKSRVRLSLPLHYFVAFYLPGCWLARESMQQICCPWAPFITTTPTNYNNIFSNSKLSHG